MIVNVAEEDGDEMSAFSFKLKNEAKDLFKEIKDVYSKAKKDIKNKFKNKKVIVEVSSDGKVSLNVLNEDDEEVDADLNEYDPPEILMLERQIGIRTTNTEELKDIKNGTFSKTSFGLSLLAGYRFDVGRFGFITELGADINFANKLGSNDNKELEVTSGTLFYLTHKLGYHFFDNNLSYVTIGGGYSSLKVGYEDLISHNKGVPSFILGIGNEYRINDNLSMFGEFNLKINKAQQVKASNNTNFGNLKTNEKQFKFGVRYYFA